MGFFLIKADSRPTGTCPKRKPPVQPAGPKTHTPGLQAQDRVLRFYNPALGRWISRDPIGEKGGENHYVVTDNNPLNSIDYLGLTTIVGTEEKTPFEKEFTLGDPTRKCGKGKVYGTVAAWNEVQIKFDWSNGEDWKSCCICDVGLGWIQHVKDHGKWSYDNPNYAFPPGSPDFIPSDPSAPNQPKLPDDKKWGKPGNPKSPYYGGGDPLSSIEDMPSNPAGDSFVTQLVCPSTGQVLFTFTWRFTGLRKGPNGDLLPNKLIYETK